MQSTGNTKNLHEAYTKSALLLLAIAINALEYLFPRIPFLPWLKPGLANAVTIIWIVKYGTLDAIVFTLVRSWITAFYFGFSLISLVLSMSGGLLAVIGMGIMWNLFGKRGISGLFGIGIIGAALHNTGQLIGVYLVLTRTSFIFYQAPFMLIASLIFGGFVGLLAYWLFPVIEQSPLPASTNNSLAAYPGIIGKKIAIPGITILLVSVLIAILQNPIILLTFATLATLLVQIIKRVSLAYLLYPLTKFWLLFLFVAIMYLFFSYGTVVSTVPFISREGIEATILQWLRLFTWIELSILLQHFHFNRLFFQMLTRMFPAKKETFLAGLFALEYFPGFFELLRKESKIDVKKFLRHPRSSSREITARLYGSIATFVSGEQK